MLSAAAAAVAVSSVLATATVSPPPTGGPWHQAGRAVTSRTGRLAHFFRSLQSPKAIAIVARSSSSRPIRLTWFTYCEFESDDAQTEEHQATATGVGTVIVLPHVLDGATLCNVSVTVRVAGGRAAAAIFGG